MIFVIIIFFRTSDNLVFKSFDFTDEEESYIKNHSQINVTITPYYDYNNHLEELEERILSDIGLNVSFSPASDGKNLIYAFDQALYLDNGQELISDYKGDFILPDVFYMYALKTQTQILTDADPILSLILSKLFMHYDEEGLFQIWRDENNFNQLKELNLPPPSFSSMKVGIINAPPVSYISNQNIYGQSILFLNTYAELQDITIEYIIGEESKLKELLLKDELDILLTSQADLPLFSDKLVLVHPNQSKLLTDESFYQELEISNYDDLVSLASQHIKVPSKMYEFTQAYTDHELNLNQIGQQEISYGFSGKKEMLENISFYSSYISLHRLESLSYFYFPNEKENRLNSIMLLIGGIIIGISIIVIIIVRLIMSINEKQRLNYLFKHDQLTYLLNHYGLKQMFTKLNLKQGMMLLIDLRHFKLLNDTFGSDTGDQVLIELAQVFSDIDSSLIVSRTSGDQYTFLTSDGGNYLDQILNAFLEYKTNNPNAINLDISACYVNFPQHGQSFDEVNQYLESAMYYAKSINKVNDWVEFTDDIYKNYLEEQELSLEIQKALDNNDFTLFYQPQTDLNTEKTIGAEVLIRWHHKERGTIYPDQFLGVAERNGLMRQLDMYMIRNACQQVKTWQDQAYEKMKISVNMSTYTFEGLGMTEELLGIIESSSIDTSWFAIEITEESGLTNINKAQKIMNDIKARGVRFALDDFGKGYSSINYLEKLPFDFLKIDKAFVDHIHTSDKSKSLYYLITDLAKLYDMHIIAEGVEYLEQIQVIKKDMNTIIQGYYYSKPLTLEDFENRIQNQ